MIISEHTFKSEDVERKRCAAALLQDRLVVRLGVRSAVAPPGAADHSGSRHKGVT